MRTRARNLHPKWRAWRVASILLWLGSSAIIVSLTGGGWFGERAKGAPGRAGARGRETVVSAEWLASHRKGRDVVVLDARSPEAYGAGHIPGALSIPVDSLAAAPDPRPLLSRAGLSGRERIVCCADSGSSPAAARLFWLVELAGAERARVLDGGLAAWRRAGGSLDTATAKRRSAEWNRAAELTHIASRGYVDDHFGEPGYEIFDARSEAEWEGRSTPVSAGASTAPRAGHVPHSLPFDFRALLLPDGTLAAPDTIRARVAKAGPREATPVNLDAEFLVYDDGRSGLGALGILALRSAGIEPTRYFPGGWSEWAADSTLPTVRIVGIDELRPRLNKKRRVFAPEIPEPSFVFLDVRAQADHNASHIRGSILLQPHEFSDSLDVVLGRNWPGVDRARVPLVVYCYGPDCIRSRNCATMAARQGFTRLEWFRDGIVAWENAHYEVVATKSE